jgi:telomerase protein component 1
MNTNWLTVRVFISSTFRDMQAERDWLVRFIFPRLREESLPRRIHLVDVDLRWGVTGGQDALEVCKEIIDECRPRLLCMLGGRYGWVPPGKTHSITADEVHYGVLDRTLKDRGFAYFYFRDDGATTAMVETSPGEFREPQGSDNQHKLAELKRAINAAGLNPFTYPAQWDNESRRLTGLREFGDRVYDDLLQSMKSDPDLGNRFISDAAAQPDEFAEEDAAMEAFVAERSERFVLGSRETVLKELLAHARGTGGDGYVCLTGAPGSGKSALLAHLSQQGDFNSHPSTILIRHFVGASPGSTDMRRTLRRLCHELKEGCPEITADIPDDPERLRGAFWDYLRQASANKRVVVLLDAVNQFDTASHSTGLHWLPYELPSNARVILSAIDGPALEELRHRINPPKEVELKPLTTGDTDLIITQFLDRYRKTMTNEQRAALLAKTNAGMPLYLLAALEELRTLGTYEEITRRIAELPPTTHELFAWILERLENDDGFRDAAGRRVGHEMVSRFAALLGASRYGLSQRELTDLLDTGDPRGNVAALLHLLRPYLMRRGELLDFYHGQFRAAAEEAWLKTDPQRHAGHTALATYFRAQADPSGMGNWAANGTRGLSELPYHLCSGMEWALLEQTLVNLRFVEHKCNVGMAHGLERDYQMSLRQAPLATREKIHPFASFLSGYMEPITNFPELVVPLAYNHSDRGSVVEAADLLLQPSGDDKRVWICVGNRRLFSPRRAQLRAMAGHTARITAVAISRDGKWGLSGSTDTTVRVWNLQTGLCAIVLRLHRHEVSAVAMADDGSKAVSGDAKGMMCVWNAATGSCMYRLQSPGRQIDAIGLSADHRHVICGSREGELLKWDLRTGEARQLAKIPGRWAITPDGRTAALGDARGIISVWDTVTEKQVAEFADPRCPVIVLGISADGNLVVSASQALDHTVRTWDARTGRCVRTMEGYAECVNQVAVDFGSGTAVAAARATDFPVHVWSIRASPWRELKGHFAIVNSVAISDGAKVVLSGGDDRIVRCWDVYAGDSETEESSATPHHWPVTSVHAGSDNQVAVSATGSLNDAFRVKDSRPLFLQMLEDNAATDAPWGEVVAWQVPTGLEKRRFEYDATSISDVVAIPNTNGLAWSDWHRRVTIWPSGDPAVEPVAVELAHRPLRLAATPEGSLLVSAGRDGYVSVIDTESRTVVRQGRIHRADIWAMSVSPCGDSVVTTGDDGDVLVSDLDQFQCIAKVASACRGFENRLAVNQDGRWIAFGNGEGAVVVCDWTLCGTIAELKIDIGGNITAVAFSPGGDCLAFCNDLGQVLLWDLLTRTLRAEIRAHTDAVTCICFSPGGRYLASASEDHAVGIWSVSSGDRLARLWFQSPITSMSSWLPAHSICTGLADGNVNFLEVRNLSEEGPPIVTAAYVRRWHYDTRRRWLPNCPPFGSKAGAAAVCKWCGRIFGIPQSLRRRLKPILLELNSGESPLLSLADDAWSQPQLLSECPLCHKPLKFNPFIVDSRGRY